MALIPYDPFRQLSSISKDFERFFSDFPFQMDETRFGPIRVDVFETENEVVASCDLPGLEKKEDVDIHIENNVLTVSGSVNRLHEVKEENMYRKERFTGKFQRSIQLPAPVSHEGVKATYRNGVLEIRMPKMTNENRKKIDVDFH